VSTFVEDRHVLVLGDQLTHHVGPLAGADPARTTILLIESTAWARRRRYHRQKLVLVWSAMRHFAEESRALGFRVHEYRVEAFEDGLRAHLAAYPGCRIELMGPAEHGLAASLASTVQVLGGTLRLVPNQLWLSSEHEFDAWAAGRRSFRMEYWYRLERRRTGWLMVDREGRPARPGAADAQPVGGTWNLDRENRQRVPTGSRFAPPPAFRPDAITRTIMQLVERDFESNPGELAGFDWPVTRQQALEALDDFASHRLTAFGPYQDALVDGDATLAHSLLSAPLNLGLLSAAEVCERALDAYERSGGGSASVATIPLASIEGFIRQLLGWREFLRHIYRLRMPGLATAAGLGHDGGLPGFYWTGETQMRCLGEAVRAVLARGHAHHIQRLMVLGNWALLAGVEARQVDDWFLELFVDAFDWVVIPNVMGTSQWADQSFTSKPHVSGGAYIDRMSDHCGRCPYDPRQSLGAAACPFGSLYWDFVARHGEALATNARMGNAVRSWLRRDDVERRAIRERAEQVLQLASEGRL
jgi:deoxyribodipyrimidine photolyase-related protein